MLPTLMMMMDFSEDGLLEIQRLAQTVLGAQFAGLILNWIAAGIVTVQLTLYFERFQDNRPTLLIVIIAIAIYLISTYVYILYSSLRHLKERLADGKFSALAARAMLTVLLAPTMGAISKFGSNFNVVFVLMVVQACLIQCFFVYRVWLLTRCPIQTTISAACVLGQMSAGVYFVVTCIHAILQELQGRTVYALTIWYFIEITASMVIAVIMSISLLRRRTGIEETNTILSKLVLYVVSTGGYNIAISILSLIGLKLDIPTVSTISGSLYGACFTMVLLTNLHSRTSVRKALHRQVHIDFGEWQSTVGGLSRSGWHENRVQMRVIDIRRESKPTAISKGGDSLPSNQDSDETMVTELI